jgi:two-component system phosphate regulon sensor histidine kinase PhoR
MNVELWFAERSGKITPWLAGLVCFGVAALAWFGYRATDEWQRSSALLVERRADEVTSMLATALTRDMRAVQTAVLDGREWGATVSTSPYEVTDQIAGAFARYPYPEVFFGWQEANSEMVFFGRTERLPNWLGSSGEQRYPVEVLRNQEVASSLQLRIKRDIAAKRLRSVFETTIDGTPYQIVARLLYSSSNRDDALGGFGVLVNLNWVRENYFAVITTQVVRIAGAGEGLVSTILDDNGRPIPGLPMPTPGEGPLKTRAFPVTFFDPMLVALNPPPDLPLRKFTVQVSAVSDPTLALAARGARRTLLVIAAGALTLGLGLLITTRAARAMSDLSSMRSDFVSTVTHELKTPVQVIRGIGETLVRGRVSTAERLHEYAQLLVQESHRLSRLIENLLAYARVTDVTQIYAFEPQRPADLVNEALHGFNRLLADGGFRVVVSVPQTLPPVKADKTAMILALDNLIDNAMRYSGPSRDLRITSDAKNESVSFAVTDCGVGIPANELELVRRRFVRGRTAEGHGSGLGLAIVGRIAADHGGAFTIESVEGSGTTATLTLPRSM